jgi:uncharacterized protein YndB with AHSA1/START domain
MIQVENTVQISRSRDEVFEYLTQVENLVKWQANAVQARALDDGPLRMGFKFEQTLKFGPQAFPAVCTVTDIKANERFAFSMKSAGPVDCDARFNLQPLLGGTNLTLNGEARLKGFWRLLRPVFAAGLKSETRKELQTLKRLIEAEVASSAR